MNFKNIIEPLLKNYDDEKVNKYRLQYENNIIEERRLFIKNTTPKEFINADIKNIDKRLISFMRNEKRFCWISGVKGSGKTYNLYAIRNFLILNKGYIYFDVQMEGELCYDVNFKKIDAVDNLGISESKFKFLADYYFNLIDWSWKQHKKLYLTSTLSYSKWIEILSKYNTESAEAIASRFSNNIEIIELTGDDKRKIK
jgi:DNA replication protein DnaC